MTYAQRFARPAPVLHVVAVDGTTNGPEDAADPSRRASFCVRFARAVDAAGLATRSHYYPGVGSESDLSRGLRRWAEVLVGGRVRNLADDVVRALRSQWSPGDRVVMVGFSRGAAVVSRAAETIGREGLDYDNPVGSREVEALVLLDRVVALGLPFADYADRRICPPAPGVHVRRVLHLVARDERRRLFEPTLLELADGADPATREEVLLPGCHADVGGSWADDPRLGDLAATVALRWIDRRVPGLGTAAALAGAGALPDADGALHHQRTPPYRDRELRRRLPGTWAVHRGVLDRAVSSEATSIPSPYAIVDDDLRPLPGGIF